MLERLTDMPPGVDGIRATGELTRQDYRETLEPLLEEARRDGRTIRLLYHFAPEFTGFSAGGAWEDARLGIGHLRRFERCALVSDVDWIQRSAHLLSTLVPCPLAVFENEQWEEALRWISRPGAEAGMSHRLLRDWGILVVEPHGPIHREDLEEVALTVDPWIEENDKLDGLVVHARRFPGWEDLDSLLRHLQFVRDRHQHIRRVALAMDTPVAKAASKLGDHFLKAQIQQFDYDQYEDALEWATGAT